jgi:hypothetical protein
MIKSLGGHANALADVLLKIDARSCAKYILKEGTREEKRSLVEKMKQRLILKEKMIYSDIENFS